MGKYEIEPGAVLTISFEKGELLLAWPGEDNSSTKLIPISQDELVNPVRRFSKFRLTLDKTGKNGWIEQTNQYQEVGFKALKVEA